MPGLLRPEDLKTISLDAETEEYNRERDLKKKKVQQEHDLREAFMARKVAEKALAIERVNNAIRIAAQNGQQHLQVITFPSSYCSDGGRRINIADPEWPTTLTGFAKDAYDFYDSELRPLGYKLRAEIINFPGGMPGEVAMSLAW
jgi:hypothetical protein